MANKSNTPKKKERITLEESEEILKRVIERRRLFPPPIDENRGVQEGTKRGPYQPREKGAIKELYFITGNKGKVKEATEKLQPLGFSVVQKDLGYPEVQADCLEEVAQQGIEYVRAKFHQAFMLEDAGLFIDALRGFPGVYSKYVFFTIGLPGILRLLQGAENRKGVFRSVYAYSEPGQKPVIVVGECNGTISTEPRGEHGFGYDSLFIPKGAKKTFGEMTIEEKNQYSHRAKALEKLITELKNTY